MSAAGSGTVACGGKKLTECLATGFYIGLLPRKLTGFKKFTGAGFMGTALALALSPYLPTDNLPYALFLAAFCLAAVRISDAAARMYGTHDDPRIVVDEIAGYWIAIAFMERTIFSLTSAFILFRILDTLKPWPIKRIETSLPSGMGIVFDDALAGVEANLLTRSLMMVWPW